MSQVKPFKILKRGDIKKSGTTLEYIQEVECPGCGHTFFQNCSEGCFHAREEPMLCPKCNYPLSALMKKEEWNPSQRLR